MITVQDLQVVEGKPRVHDLKIAESLRFERPRKIRDLIERNKDRLSRRGEVCTVVGQTSDAGGRPSTEYWLTKWQAIKICMWSEAPGADLVQDEIADVFDAYTDGKLVPLGQAPITAEVLGQLFEPLFKTAQLTYEVAKGTDGKVVQLLISNARLESTSARIEQRMNDVIPRKEPSEKNQRIYRYTIEKRFEGCCPCGCRRKILDEMGEIMLDEAGQPVAVYDHWYTRERNGLAAMWLVHRKCNQLLKDDDYRKGKKSRYDVFHEERAAVQDDVPKPKDDCPGQIKMKFD